MSNTVKIAFCLVIVALAAMPAAAAAGRHAARGSVVVPGPGSGIISDSCATVTVGPCRTRPDSW
jgi:hypothetical protein